MMNKWIMFTLLSIFCGDKDLIKNNSADWPKRIVFAERKSSLFVMKVRLDWLGSLVTQIWWCCSGQWLCDLIYYLACATNQEESQHWGCVYVCVFYNIVCMADLFVCLSLQSVWRRSDVVRAGPCLTAPQLLSCLPTKLPWWEVTWPGLNPYIPFPLPQCLSRFSVSVLEVDVAYYKLKQFFYFII